MSLPTSPPHPTSITPTTISAQSTHASSSRIDSNTRTRKYHLTTNDADQDGAKIITLSDEMGRTIWTKTRSLTDDEMVDTIHDSHSQPRWTIHRPRAGWYIALRSPSLPQGSHIGIKAVKGKEGELEFVARTRPIERGAEEEGEAYVKVEVRPEEEQVEEKGTKEQMEEKETRLEHCLLRPRLPLHAHRVASSNATTGWRLGTIAKKVLGAEDNTWSCLWRRQEDALGEGAQVEVMRFEEEISLLGTATKGTLFLAEDPVEALGMEPSFWVAVALAYLEHLEDREAYHAASTGD